MIVSELIELLSDFSPHAKVIISANDGSSFSLGAFVESGVTISENDEIDFISDDDIEEDHDLNLADCHIAVCIYGEEL